MLNLSVSSQKAHSHLLFLTIQHQFSYFIVVTGCLKAQVLTQSFISDFQPGKELQAHLRETDCRPCIAQQLPEDQRFIINSERVRYTEYSKKQRVAHRVT